jgi:uncharacterized protein YyaL (SSP411 family)
MPHPTERNRLEDAASPYLQQHAENPVNWQPWDDDALEAAREQGVPIFLSVGYAACHWCHVMAEESFEDETVAQILNDSFVPIKVDREERPDLDRLYQTICQQVSGRGGWPLSVWLTPDGRPFFVGTYFPKEGRGQQQPGFPDLCERLADAWANDREEIERRAEQWTDAIRGELEETPEAPGEAPDAEALTAVADAALRAADREHGGFGSGGPKFPQPGRLQALLWAHDRTGRDAYREVVGEALDAMADRGTYDHLGGGFHRYATDREWTVPHFEKMLYDQGELVRAYLAGWQALGRERYREVARETLAFLDRELAHPDGGFFATLDAQSEDPETGEREEGAFYTWMPGEVHAAIEDEETAEVFCARYGVAEPGNFEGRNTLRRVASIADLAEQFESSEDAVRERLEAATETLRAVREERPRPRRDEKVIAGWNGLAISAFAEAGIVLDGPAPATDADGSLDHAERAHDALWFVREHLWDAEEGTLARRYADGDVAGPGYLEDYAFLARGAFDCYQATGDPEPLGFALELARAIRRDFWDADAATLYMTPSGGETLVARPQEVRDQSTPSSLGVALSVLCSLDGFSAAADFQTVVETVLATHGDSVRSRPIEHPSLALAADRHASGDLELTLAADSLPAAWRETLAETYLPKRLLAHRPPDADGLASWCDRLGLDAPGPIWAERNAVDGEATVYACRDFTCSPPKTDLAAALEWARGEPADPA